MRLSESNSKYVDILAWRKTFTIHNSTLDEFKADSEIDENDGIFKKNENVLRIPRNVEVSTESNRAINVLFNNTNCTNSNDSNTYQSNQDLQRFHFAHYTY